MTTANIILIALLPIAIIIVVFSIVFGPIVKRSLLKKRLLKEGLPATGTLVNVRQTNMRINSSPVIELTLDVKSNLGESWQVKIKEIITIFQIQLLKPGATFNILYDANDKTKVVLDKTTSPFQ